MQYILSHIILKSMLFKDTVLLNNLASYVPHRELTLFTVLYIVVVVVFFGTVGAYMPLIERGVYLRRRDSIHHFHIDHNAPYLPPPPPPILHHRCFQFLLGIAVVRREIEDDGYAKFCGEDKEHHGLCESSEFSKLLVIFPGFFCKREFCIFQEGYRCLTIFSVFPRRQ